MRMAPAEEAADPTADPWAEFIRVTAPEFRRPTIEQQETVTKPIWEALVAGARYSHDRLMEIWDDVRPDLICTDNVTGFPSVEIAGCPWARFVSANPLEMRDASASAAALGAAGRRPLGVGDVPRRIPPRPRRRCSPSTTSFAASVGVAPCPPDEFNTHSPALNLYLFPEAADYLRSRPLDGTWHRLQSTVRTSDAAFDVQEHLPGDGKLVYLSLGSLGCMDVGLMQRLIDALAETPHRVIVSMGPLKDEMTLGPNMYGDQFLPQPSILPQCDLLITHGGNNTTCEGFHFGLPMIGLPLFWDQYDNAQRLRETGFGERLPTYDWTPEELTGAVDRLLADDDLAATMRRNAAAIQADDGKTVGAILLERLAAGA